MFTTISIATLSEIRIARQLPVNQQDMMYSYKGVLSCYPCARVLGCGDLAQLSSEVCNLWPFIGRNCGNGQETGEVSQRGEWDSCFFPLYSQ